MTKGLRDVLVHVEAVPWPRPCLGHPVVDATVAWLKPTDNRSHNRVVSTVSTLEPSRGGVHYGITGQDCAVAVS
jgi:hypothetical protein